MALVPLGAVVPSATLSCKTYEPTTSGVNVVVVPVAAVNVAVLEADGTVRLQANESVSLRPQPVEVFGVVVVSKKSPSLSASELGLPSVMIACPTAKLLDGVETASAKGELRPQRPPT